MKTVAVIQARMGSSRLPGKVMLSLDCDPVLDHSVTRVGIAERVDTTVVATTDRDRDDIIAQCASRLEVPVYRGSESDVLDRMFQAARSHAADVVVRITADCPLVPPECIDAVVEELGRTGSDYAANIVERTFPRGFDVEAFTFESFRQVHDEASGSHHREHVTPYYREDPSFDTVNVESSTVFDEEWMHDRTDLRLTLDKCADYELLRDLYTIADYETYLPARDAVSLVDEMDLSRVNRDVRQKTVTDASDDTR